MGAVVEIWFESLISFLLKDSHIVQCYFAFIQAGNLRPFECSQWREAKNVTGVTLHLLRQTI